MAFGDQMPLLPGGSRVEGFDASSFSNSRGASRRRRAAILVLSTVAAVACLATITVKGLSAQNPVELEGKPVAQKSPAALALEGHLPSWLQTGPVKVMPLKYMIKEQEIARAEAQGKISDKLAAAEEEAAHQGPSPRELAMKNAHVLAAKKQSLHAEAQVKVQSHKGKVAHAAPVQQQTQAPEAKVAPAAKAPEAKAAPAAKAPEAKTAQAKAEPKSIAAELKEKKEELEKLISGEKTKEAEIKKMEVHQLAMLKKADKQREASLQHTITKLEGEQNGAILNEKAKLKAQMAKIEDEEKAKLAALKKKMGALGSSDAATAAAPKAAAPKAEAPKAEAPKAEATKATRAHKVVAKAPVKVHTDAAAEAMSKPALQTKGRTQQLAWGDHDEGKKAECNDDNCSLKKEDKKWLAHKSDVDKFADEAMKGSGNAKKAAIARMRALQKQIENDYKHVTKFAVTQEYALPPVKK